MSSGPAVVTAAGLMVITIVSEVASQGPAGLALVKVRVTDPAVISAALGV